MFIQTWYLTSEKLPDQDGVYWCMKSANIAEDATNIALFFDKKTKTWFKNWYGLGTSDVPFIKPRGSSDVCHCDMWTDQSVYEIHDKVFKGGFTALNLPPKNDAIDIAMKEVEEAIERYNILVTLSK